MSFLGLSLPPPTILRQHFPRSMAARALPSTTLHEIMVAWPGIVQPPHTAANGLPLLKSCLGPALRAGVCLASGSPGGHEKLHWDGILNARKVFDSLPQPVKDFPWIRALCIFQNLVFGLAVVVAKYLCVPLLAISSLSEMSYCAHERKMGVIPIPFLVGFALAGIISNAAVDLSSSLKEGENPWHLILTAAFFLLLKIPGPYYPYWGRLVIPHFANGGLWRTAWLAFIWHTRHQKPVGETNNAVVA